VAGGSQHSAVLAKVPSAFMDAAEEKATEQANAYRRKLNERKERRVGDATQTYDSTRLEGLIRHKSVLPNV
jgi:hypothetical protein